MTQRIEGYFMSGVADAAIAQYLRVKWDGSYQWTLAGDEASFGTMEGPALAAGDPCSILMRNAPGTKIYIASGAISKGASVSSVAGGKIQTGTGGAEDLGVALNAAAADGDQVEVLPPL